MKCSAMAKATAAYDLPSDASHFSVNVAVSILTIICNISKEHTGVRTGHITLSLSKIRITVARHHMKNEIEISKEKQ